MTKRELAELDKRIAFRIARKGISARPVSAAEKRRFDELLRKKRASEIEFVPELLRA